MAKLDNVRIAVDAMGGDGGIATVVAGVELALDADPSLNIILVAPRSELEAIATVTDKHRARLETVVAETVLSPGANTAQAVRRGKGSSMWMALELLENGGAEGVVSGGSTGALMALSRHLLGTLPGVERPALMGAIPTVDQPAWMLDLGANVNVDARRLLEFAQIGHVACKVLQGKGPRIGLLNIGTEPGKGPDVIREAARLIEAEPSLNYTGFVEADQVFNGSIDLVVCDGFAGNVLLKSAEGAVRLLFSSLRDGLKGSLGGWMARGRLRELHDRLDPARHNGAPMLGVRGTVIKSHGSTCARGFSRAIQLAALQARRDLVTQLESQLWASY
ncbi:MAG: phosphate acyltransferase PlsX [Wenzhouxiangella sp.]